MSVVKHAAYDVYCHLCWHGSAVYSQGQKLLPGVGPSLHIDLATDADVFMHQQLLH